MARTHGASGYTAGCRCEICTAANTKRVRERRREQAAARGPKRISIPETTARLLASLAKAEGAEPVELAQELLEVEVIRVSSLGPMPPLAPGMTFHRVHHEWASKRWPEKTTRERQNAMLKMTTPGEKAAT